MNFYEFFNSFCETLGIAKPAKFLLDFASVVDRDPSTVHRWKREDIPPYWLKKNRSKIAKILDEAVHRYCAGNPSEETNVLAKWEANSAILVEKFPLCPCIEHDPQKHQSGFSSDDISILKKLIDFLENL